MRAGFATVYEGAGAVYGTSRASLEAIEKRARYDAGARVRVFRDHATVRTRLTTNGTHAPTATDGWRDRAKRRGMWAQNMRKYVSPMDNKKLHRSSEPVK